MPQLIAPSASLGNTQNRRIKILEEINLLTLVGASNDSGKICALKNEYNKVVNDLYRDTPGKLWDIIAVYPPDIWIKIIQHVLPPYYSAASLLYLTMVSVRWQKAIISSPVLWAHIEICGSDEDSLAAIETCIVLSQNSELLLSIYVPLLHDAEVIDSILRRVNSRLRKVIVRADIRVIGEQPTNAIFDGHIRWVMKLLLGSPHYIPNITQIDVVYPTTNRVVHMNHDIPDVLNKVLPRHLTQITGWCFCAGLLKLPLDFSARLQAFTTCRPVEELAPFLRQLVDLRDLTIAETSGAIVTKTIMPKDFGRMSTLNTLTFDGQFTPVLMDILASTISHLSELKLILPYTKCYRLLEHLGTATRLVKMSLQIREKGVGLYEDTTLDSPYPHLDTYRHVPTLRTLEIYVDGTYTPENLITPVVKFFIAGLGELTTGVENAFFSLDLAEYLLPDVLAYIPRLPNLKDFHLDGSRRYLKFKKQAEIFTPTLETLSSTSSQILSLLKAPNLHSLSLFWDQLCEQTILEDHPNVHALQILETSQDLIDFPQGCLPSLRTLNLMVSGFERLRFTDFLYLQEISITAEAETPIATSLCLAILYDPEKCPSLGNIVLIECAPEWDILFLMLERRNFLTRLGISRINRITLPYIPHHLRDPLASLLRGVYTKRPPNEELSFLGMMELAFDENMYV
ncbi:hypothetical protein M408DRAFT_30619 [Serendipita vermifera MAFF 305830]|uniref:F-box domain-containing protein n=1 Tax=Serendipita vermifera MAFF 305830 TaxID=933852 RepID=A0A0C2W0W3_SERVB|nr:hypothetical protein M408DRAFT_30619 [Serendipita vermifera MAFF 305830]